MFHLFSSSLSITCYCRCVLCCVFLSLFRHSHFEVFQCRKFTFANSSPSQFSPRAPPLPWFYDVNSAENHPIGYLISKPPNTKLMTANIITYIFYCCLVPFSLRCDPISSSSSAIHLNASKGRSFDCYMKKYSISEVIRKMMFDEHYRFS